MVFSCVAMMSRAIGPKTSKEVKDLLEPMLSVGLRYRTRTVIHRIVQFLELGPNLSYIVPVMVLCICLGA